MRNLILLCWCLLCGCGAQPLTKVSVRLSDAVSGSPLAGTKLVVREPVALLPLGTITSAMTNGDGTAVLSIPTAKSITRCSFRWRTTDYVFGLNLSAIDEGRGLHSVVYPDDQVGVGAGVRVETVVLPEAVDGSDTAPRMWLVETDGVPGACDEMSALAETKLVAAGVEAGRAKLLASDLKAVLRAVMTADIGPYAKLVTDRGAVLGERAGAWIEEELATGRYGAVVDSGFDTRPMGERVAVMWAHPELRRARLKAVGRRGLECGTEWNASPARMMQGITFQLTLFQHPAERIIAERAKTGGGGAAYVEFPVEYTTGWTSVVRYIFGFDEDQGKWLPMRVELLGKADPEGPVRPRLLF